ncbi:MAG: hypothetical protein ACR2KE_00575 [Candidatus Nanopelagicales bacterium]
MADQDPNIARLQAADPAADAPDPQIAEIRAKVLAEGNVVPLKRRRAALTVGAIAAGVALLAGTAVASAAIGRATAPQPETVTAASAPVAENSLPVIGTSPNSPQMPSVGAPGVAAGGNAGPMGAPAAMSAAGTADAKMSVYPGWGWGSAFLPDPSLPDEPGAATGYRLVSDGVNTIALARQLAAAFGVSGEPREQDGSVIVGPDDGSGPMIWVSNDAMVSWSYSDPTQSPYDCGVSPAPADASSGNAVGAAGVSPAAPESCDPKQKPMSEQDAVRAARKILASAGVTEDPAAGIDIEWEAGSDDYTTWATAWQRVNGNRTQLSWSFTFGAKSAVWANGFAAGLEPVPGYPIVGALTAVQRTQDPRYSAFGPTPLDYGGPMPMVGEARGTESSTSDATASAPQGDPTKVQLWWDPITVTGAEPTLAQYWQPDGTLLLLPAYKLTTADDRGTWAVIAVNDSAIEWVDPNAG